MRIGFDAKRLFNNFTGLGNYSRTLVLNLAKFFPEHQYFLFTPSITENARTKPFLTDDNFTVICPSPRMPFWRTGGMIQTKEFNSLDVFHGLSHELPVGIRKSGIRSVVTMHDLIFKYFPQDYKWFDRVSYDLKFRSACMRADGIIAISEQTKRDLVRYYSVDPGKVEVIYQSCDPSFGHRVDEEEIRQVKERHRLPEDYLLYVGSVIRRKNLGTLLAALKQIPEEKRLPLVVIGDGGRYLEELRSWIREHFMTEWVYFRESLPFSDFPAVYQGAAVFIFPSLHEGFGIPVIEALHSGIPVITSNRSALTEAGGDLAIYVDPDDPADLAATILEQLKHPHARSMEENRISHLTSFDPEVVTLKLMTLYQSL
jgi:glycosyltransferase involved in cell wall biosynthesis